MSYLKIRFAFSEVLNSSNQCIQNNITTDILYSLYGKTNLQKYNGQLYLKHVKLEM